MRRRVVGSVAILLVSSALLVGCGAGGGQPPSGDRPDGAELLFWPSGAESAQNPAFSPDDSSILFTLFHGGYNVGPAGLFLLGGPQTPPVALLDEPGQDSVNAPGASWNAHTGLITFASDRVQTEEIWVVAADGSQLTQVTHHATNGSRFIEPTFSPDGEWIVFEVDNQAPQEQQQGSIFKVRSDGTDVTQLTDGPGGGTDDRLPNWSPVGDRILFQRREPGSDDWNIFTMTPVGTDIQQVTTAPSADTDASWSPDGQWIAYSSDHGGITVPNIFAIDVETKAVVRVTNDDVHEDGAPTWSHDGRRIAFESHIGASETSPSALWCIAAP